MTSEGKKENQIFKKRKSQYKTKPYKTTVFNNHNLDNKPVKSDITVNNIKASSLEFKTLSKDVEQVVLNGNVCDFKTPRNVKMLLSDAIKKLEVSAENNVSLKKEEKLHVKENETNINNLISSALSHLTGIEEIENMAYKLKVAGVYVMFSYGLVNIENCDVIIVSEKGKFVNTYIPSEEDIQTALFMIVSIKMNFFAINRHTEFQKLTRYTLKAAKIILPNENYDDKDLLKTINMIAHWADTKKVLKSFGFEGIADSECLAGLPDAKIDISDYNILYDDCMPPGTAKISLSYKILKLLVFHELSIVCPKIEEMENIIENYTKIKNNRPAYHLRAPLLTGEVKQQHDDNFYTKYLGILSAFATILFPTNSIVFSPVIMRLIEDKVSAESYYDIDSEGLCVKYKRAYSGGKSGTIKELLKVSVDEKIARDLILARIKERFITEDSKCD